MRRALSEPSEPIERIYRDLSFYVRHDNDDHILANIGESVLGLPHGIVVHPAPENRVNDLDHPAYRLARIPPEDVSEFCQ
jgi:hypothetical protein